MHLCLARVFSRSGGAPQLKIVHLFFLAKLLFCIYLGRHISVFAQNPFFWEICFLFGSTQVRALRRQTNVCLKNTLETQTRRTISYLRYKNGKRKKKKAPDEKKVICGLRSDEIHKKSGGEMLHLS